MSTCVEVSPKTLSYWQVVSCFSERTYTPVELSVDTASSDCTSELIGGLIRMITRNELSLVLDCFDLFFITSAASNIDGSVVGLSMYIVQPFRYSLFFLNVIGSCVVVGRVN